MRIFPVIAAKTVELFVTRILVALFEMRVGYGHPGWVAY